MWPSESIALRSRRVTDPITDLGVGDEADTRDVRRLREAVDELADLVAEAVEVLSGHEGDALVRQDVPTIPDDPADVDVHATADDLQSLYETARWSDQAATAGAVDRLAGRIGAPGGGLLYRQLVAAGAATLLEVLAAD